MFASLELLKYVSLTRERLHGSYTTDVIRSHYLSIVFLNGKPRHSNYLFN